MTSIQDPAATEMQPVQPDTPRQPGEQDFTDIRGPPQGQDPAYVNQSLDGAPVNQSLDGAPQQPPAAYPNQVPDEVAQAVKQAEAEGQAKTVLDNIPGLMGDKDRQGFVIKVYSLILIMLGVTGLWCYLTFNTQGIKDFVLGNIWLYYVTLVIVIGISCSLPYKYNQLKKAPFSYIMLSIYTLTHAYLIAVLILFYKVETIYQAAATTAGMFVVLTAYAVYAKGDMQYLGAAISSLGNSLFWLIMWSFVWPGGKWLYMFIAVIVVIFISLFIVYDTRMIVGGQHKKFALTIDDYAIGAMILYSDIITLFIYLLQIFGGGGNN